MKKLAVILMGMSLMSTGTVAYAQQEGQAQQVKTVQTKTAYNAVNHKLQEPTKKTTCTHCNMKVYRVNDTLGAYAAQATDKHGKNLFFDDVGCMFSYQFKHDTVVTKYVRDYQSKKWMRLSKAIIVKSDEKTPMGYGYTFFNNQQDAKRFIKKAKNAKMSSIHAIKKDAKKRFDAMNGSGGNHGDMHMEHK